ncbi:MAG: hypothetical protein IOC86_06480 [Aestuariivirga sp.]|nr:hypothetical protein [Aestuariivirga sp.]
MEIKAFEGTPQQKALLAEIDAVKAHFKAANFRGAEQLGQTPNPSGGNLQWQVTLNPAQ